MKSDGEEITLDQSSMHSKAMNWPPVQTGMPFSPPGLYKFHVPFPIYQHFIAFEKHLKHSNRLHGLVIVNKNFKVKYASIDAPHGSIHCWKLPPSVSETEFSPQA